MYYTVYLFSSLISCFLNFNPVEHVTPRHAFCKDDAEESLQDKAPVKDRWHGWPWAKDAQNVS